MNGANKVRQMGLGADLRQLREGSGMSTRSVAERLGVSRMAVNRTEVGRRTTPTEEVIALCALYGVTGRQRERLVERASGGDGSSSWLATGPAMADQVMSLVALENEASWITDVALGLIPGLLQTPEYMRAVVASSPAPEWMVRTRLGRQGLLTGPNAPEVRFLIEESVLHRPIGGATVLHEQLEHLLRISAKSHVSIQVIPLKAGKTAALDGSFVILGFPGRNSHAYVEARGSGLILTRPDDIEPFERGLPEINDAVLDEARSAKLISQIKEDLPDARADLAEKQL